MFKNGAKLTIFLSKMPVFECDTRTVNPCVVSSSLTGAANKGQQQLTFFAYYGSPKRAVWFLFFKTFTKGEIC